jgi:hypothetical protein
MRTLKVTLEQRSAGDLMAQSGGDTRRRDPDDAQVTDLITGWAR